MICNKELSVLVLTHKDRLLRFGSEIIIQLCENFNIEVIILNKDKEESFEKTLCNDIISIMTVFSAKLYGKRSHKNKKKLLA
jgi:putative resolvase